MQDVPVDSDESDLLVMRRRLEDITGCIPLYLKCFINCTPLNFEEIWRKEFAGEARVRCVFDQLLQFHEDIKKQHESGWRSHIDTLRSFLLGGHPHSKSYDHRYLYVDQRSGVGYIACGLARVFSICYSST